MAEPFVMKPALTF